MRKIVFIEHSRQYLLTLSNRIYYLSQMRTHFKEIKRDEFYSWVSKNAGSVLPQSIYFLELGVLRDPVFSSPKKEEKGKAPENSNTVTL